jgi:uncharacterized protein YjeT (DUF2065 family)
MTIDVLIARWVAILWILCGASHLFHPKLWAALLVPMRERETGGFILAGMSLPVGLLVILGHNIWVWDLPVIVTLAGWAASLKSAIYLLFPRAHMRVIGSAERISGGGMARALRVVGVVILLLGALVAYDAFWRR